MSAPTLYADITADVLDRIAVGIMCRTADESYCASLRKLDVARDLRDVPLHPGAKRWYRAHGLKD